MGLSCSVICVILRLAVLIQYRSETDTHTDRHTTTAYTVLSIVSRGKNYFIANLPVNLSVQKFWKSVSIWRT